MIKSFVLKCFAIILNVGFVVAAVGIVIVGLISMTAAGPQGILLGLVTIVAGLVSLVIYFGIIYLLIDIRDSLNEIKDQKNL